MVVVGSFLPWARSGRASRNGYAEGGVLKRLLHVHGAEALGLSLVPFIALAAAIAVVLILLGHGLSHPVAVLAGRVLAVLVALGAGEGCIIALTADPGLGVTLAKAGPVTAVIGAVLVCAATLVVVVKYVRIGHTSSLT